MAKAVKKDGLGKTQDKLTATKVPKIKATKPKKIEEKTVEDVLYDRLSDREKVFCHAYLITPNKAKAALAANASVAACRQNGHEIYNRPHVKEYLDYKMAEKKASTDEIIQLTTDIAYANGSDYLKPVDVVESIPVRVSLRELIAEIQEDIEIELEYAGQVQMSKDQKEAFDHRISSMRSDIIRKQIILKRRPLATEIVFVKQIVTKYVFDLEKVKNDKTARVKKIKEGQHGIEVEMYDAAAAHDKLLRIGGAFSKDNEQKAVNVSVNLSKDEIKEIAKNLEDQF